MFDNFNFQWEMKEISDEGMVEGLAAATTLDQGGDIVTPEAIKGIVNGPIPKMLWYHNPTKPIGVWNSMKAVDSGLEVKGQLLLGLAQAKEVHTMLKAGAISGLSIGFHTTKDEWKNDARHILAMDLLEVSFVTFPMNKDAQVGSVKKLDSIREVENILHEAGVPQNFARLVALYGYKEAKSRIDRRDVDGTITQEQINDLSHKLAALQEKFNA